MKTEIPKSVDEILAAGRPENGVIYNAPIALLGFVVSIVLSFAMQIIQAPMSATLTRGKPE
jgi:hypothetical protein